MSITGIDVEITPAPTVLGTGRDRITALVALMGSAVVTLGYTSVASIFDTPTSGLEGWSLVFSLACVWLARRENIWNMPFGIVAVVLMGTFYFRIELVGQAWLQIAFYIPVQVVGWWAWAHGDSGRRSLPITRLGRGGWAATLGLFAGVWVVCWVGFGLLYDDPTYLGWDTSIVASSIVAQTLMTWKKLENWAIWTVPVNVSSILLYVVTGSWAFVFLYTVFLANSTWAWWQWSKVAQSA